MKNKHLVNSPRLGVCVIVAGYLMLGTGPITFGIANNLLYKEKQRENPDKVFENAESAINTAGTISVFQMVLSMPVLGFGIATLYKKEKQRE